MGSGDALSRLSDDAGGRDAVVDTPAAAQVTVLLVEDEALIREVLQAALEDGGYLVVAADSGQAAVMRLEQGDGGYRVLVTDITLGRGPSGWDVARRARELHPDMAVVYMTAASQHEYASQGVSNSIMLGKPFGAAQFVAELAGLIGA